MDLLYYVYHKNYIKFINKVILVVSVKVQSESFSRLSSVDVQGRFNRRRLTVSKVVYCTA